MACLANLANHLFLFLCSLYYLLFIHKRVFSWCTLKPVATSLDHKIQELQPNLEGDVFFDHELAPSLFFSLVHHILITHESSLCSFSNLRSPNSSARRGHILFLILTLDFLSTIRTSQDNLNQANFLKLCKSSQKLHKIINSFNRILSRTFIFMLICRKLTPTESAVTQKVITPGYRQGRSLGVHSHPAK